MKLQMAYKAYRTRYGLDPATAYRIARYCVTHRDTIHNAWMRYDRREI